MSENKVIVDFSATKAFEDINYKLKMIIRRAVIATLEYEAFDASAEISVTLCDNEYIKSLNKQYRNKDKHTDVLSFPMYDFYSGEECETLADEPVMLGDIVISLERCREQAAELGNSFLRELAFLTIHSMLHLLGYDHERDKESEEEQCEAQKNIIDAITARGLFKEND